MTISIADLPVVDDLDVPMDPTEYVDQANPAPVKPGNYRFRATKFKVREKDGQIVLADGKYPTVTVEQVKIVEPTEAERLVGVFSDIRFKPFARKSATGADVVASDLYDFLRAVDEDQAIEGYDHAKKLLQEALETGSVFLGQIGWSGWDKDYVEQEFSKVGGKTGASKEVANAIYAKARKNTKDFYVNGVLQQSIVGPSGNTIEAQPKLTRYFPSGTEIGKGKDERGRSRIELGAFAAKK